MEQASSPIAARVEALQALLLALQTAQLLFLALHDWVPLGRLTDPRAVQAEHSRGELLRVTALQTVPWAIGLAWSAAWIGRLFPPSLMQWLWVTYGILFLGELRAWWVPYLGRPEPSRAARYRRMFGSTHSFLPERNGMVPNTAHVVLHGATAATLVVLALLSWGV